jgi:hypothetical protein
MLVDSGHTHHAFFFTEAKEIVLLQPPPRKATDRVHPPANPFVRYVSQTP